jgi:hypothetical protein
VVRTAQEFVIDGLNPVKDGVADGVGKLAGFLLEQSGSFRSVSFHDAVEPFFDEAAAMLL